MSFVLLVDYYPDMRTNVVLLYAVQVVVGLCTSITFGSLAQIVALLPTKYHYFFFTGNMCPFFVFIPVNILTGNLCNPVTNGTLTFEVRHYATHKPPSHTFYRTARSVGRGRFPSLRQGQCSLR